ncbi:MAG: NADH-quinone oxidoreductase subunit J [Phycisphaerae bacterium]
MTGVLSNMTVLLAAFVLFGGSAVLAEDATTTDSTAAAATSDAPATAGDAVAPMNGVTRAVPSGWLDAILFYFVAGVAVISSIAVCLTQNIVRMTVWLFMTLGAVAVLYFQLAANFLGAIQLIVYAGGTLVLLVFGVMLTSKSPWVRFTPSLWEVGGATVVCGLLLGVLCTVLVSAPWVTAEGVVPGTPMKAFGEAFMTTYLVPFEVAGVVLMIVMVGAAHLARQEGN